MKALGLTDGSAGMVAQVKALADALGAEIQMETVVVSTIWKWVPNCFFDLGLQYLFPVFKPSFELLSKDLIISCGRKGAIAAASLETSAKKIHIQDPQMSARHFDQVIAMQHDRIRGAKILITPLALHAITPQKLAEAAQKFAPRFAHLPAPYMAIMIGGSTNKYQLTATAMRLLIEQVRALLDQTIGSLLITTSRRTGDENHAMLVDYFAGHPRVYIYQGEDENPYLGFLALAEKILVTNDSVNMMSEALATGKPVSILPLEGHQNTKPARLAATLPTSESDWMGPLVAELKKRLNIG
jgi:uncharacterized protein